MKMGGLNNFGMNKQIFGHQEQKPKDNDEYSYNIPSGAFYSAAHLPSMMGN
jgi:hypothetical protein